MIDATPAPLISERLAELIDRYAAKPDAKGNWFTYEAFKGQAYLTAESAAEYEEAVRAYARKVGL